MTNARHSCSDDFRIWGSVNRSLAVSERRPGAPTTACAGGPSVPYSFAVTRFG